MIKPKGIENPEEWKITLQLLQIICDSGPASQTLQEAARVGRIHVYETYFEGDDRVEEDVLTKQDSMQMVFPMIFTESTTVMNSSNIFTKNTRGPFEIILIPSSLALTRTGPTSNKRIIFFTRL